jgi:hypothetical protein
MANPAAPIAQAIAEGFKLIKTVMDTADMRRKRKAIEAAEKYIMVNEKDGEYDYLNDDQQEKKLRHYHKRFFKYNQ